MLDGIRLSNVRLSALSTSDRYDNDQGSQPYLTVAQAGQPSTSKLPETFKNFYSVYKIQNLSLFSPSRQSLPPKSQPQPHLHLKMASTHKADATALLDERGYNGPLIRGQNPAHLVEKAVRDRITTSLYWMEQCYGLNAASLCDRAVDLTCIGGTYGGMGKPTPFLCLAFKLLQLGPERDVVLEFLNFEDEAGSGDAVEDGDGDGDEEDGKVALGGAQKGDFKYLRALAAFYIRLTWKPVDIYTTLEPLLADYRKLRRRIRDGFALTYMDQFIDDLLTKERVCATSLWKLPSRTTLEDLELLEPRESPLGEELDDLDREYEEMSENGANGNYTSPEPDSASYGDGSRSSGEASEND